MDQRSRELIHGMIIANIFIAYSTGLIIARAIKAISVLNFHIKWHHIWKLCYTCPVGVHVLKSESMLGDVSMLVNQNRRTWGHQDSLLPPYQNDKFDRVRFPNFVANLHQADIFIYLQLQLSMITKVRVSIPQSSQRDNLPTKWWWSPVFTMRFHARQ